MRPLGALLVLAVVTALAGPCAAAPTQDGAVQVKTDSVASDTITLSTSNAKDVILVVVQVENSTTGRTVSSVTAAGLTFTNRAICNYSSPGRSIDRLEEWWAPAASALSSKVITVTLSGAADGLNIVAMGISGANNYASPWDTNVSLPVCNSGTPTPATITGSTSGFNDALIYSSEDDAFQAQSPSCTSCVWNLGENIQGTFGGSYWLNGATEYITNLLAFPVTSFVVTINAGSGGGATNILDAIAGPPPGNCTLASQGVGPC